MTHTQPFGTPEEFQPVNEWQVKYENEHRKVRVVGGIAVGLAVVCVGAAAWGLTQSATAGTATVGTTAVSQLPGGGQGTGGGQLPGGGQGTGGGQLPGGGQGTGGGQPPGTGQLPGSPQQGIPDIAAQFFNADGSVNAAAVAEFKANTPVGADPTRFLDMAEQSGSLTAEQLAKLKQAFTTTSGTSSQGSGKST